MPKLRVTCLSCNGPPPQSAHRCSAEEDSDDDELAGEADFDDDFGARAVERDARDDALGFSSLGVALALFDLPGKDDVLEVEDGEVVI